MKAIEVAQVAPLTDQQKKNVGTIAYALHLQHVPINADEIYSAWPVGGDIYAQTRAGKRPSRKQIARWLGSDEGKDDLINRGVPVTVDDINGDDSLTSEQIALLSILSDPTLSLNLDGRLRKAGVPRPVYRSWMRQKAFNAAFKKVVGEEMHLVKENVDIALAAKAASGDLKAIQYFNDLMGRGPDSRKEVDAIAFSRTVLEAVMRHCTKEQISAIASEIELATKQAGLETA